MLQGHACTSGLLPLVAVRPIFGLTVRRFRWRYCGLVCRRAILIDSLSVNLALMLPKCSLLRRLLLKGKSQQTHCRSRGQRLTFCNRKRLNHL